MSLNPMSLMQSLPLPLNSPSPAASTTIEEKAKLKSTQLNEMMCILDDATKKTIQEIAKEDSQNQTKLFGQLSTYISRTKNQQGVIFEYIFKKISTPSSIFHNNLFYKKLKKHLFENINSDENCENIKASIKSVFTDDICSSSSHNYKYEKKFCEETPVVPINYLNSIIINKITPVTNDVEDITRKTINSIISSSILKDITLINSKDNITKIINEQYKVEKQTGGKKKSLKKQNKSVRFSRRRERRNYLNKIYNDYTLFQNQNQNQNKTKTKKQKKRNQKNTRKKQNCFNKIH